MSLNSLIANYMCNKSDKARDAGLTPPESISIIRDIRYASVSTCQVLDLYRPKSFTGKLPVIVSVHGGGWVYGTKEVYQFYCMDLATRGFAVVNFTYRLAPKYKHPCAIEDTNTVFEWVLAHADEYDMDADNIFAVGDSSGAQCLALYASIATDKSYAAKYPFKAPDKLKIKALGLNCGLYNAEVTRSVKQLADYLPRRNGADILHDITVINNINPDFPPSFVMTSNGDFFREEPIALTRQFDKYNIPYCCKEYGDEENKLMHVFHCDVKSSSAKEANDDEIAFFRRYYTT